MKLSAINIIRRSVNAVGILCVVFGSRHAILAYEHLHTIATSGALASNSQVGELPGSITPYLIVVMFGFMVFELGEWHARRAAA